MHPDLIAWVSHYGYAGIFSLLMFGIIGLPVPDETLLTLAGFLIGEGELRFVPTLAAAFGGSACGITVSFALGHYVGPRIIEKFGIFLHLDRRKLERVEVWFERIGKWTLPVSYFIPGVRHVMAIVAGSSGVKLVTFAAFAYVGALVWTLMFLGLGYYVGRDWHVVLTTIHRHVLLAIVAAALLVAGYFGVRRGFSKR